MLGDEGTKSYAEEGTASSEIKQAAGTSEAIEHDLPSSLAHLPTFEENSPHIHSRSEFQRQTKHKVKSQPKKKVSVSARTTLPLQTMDDETHFWTTYAKEAGEHDKELLEKWNKSLDVLLIFAALFSAINTAFIIESYRRLQPDPSENTTRLLRLLLIHRNDDFSFSEATLDSLLTAQGPSSAVPVNSIFFSSLSCSLMAAFGAMLAKQWLTEYATSGHMLPLHKQGRRRQERYSGLMQWHFWLLMEILPMLLQLSLLLFLVGVIYLLWSLDYRVALVVFGLTVVGLGAYLATMLVAIFNPMAPFQTPISNALRQPILSAFSILLNSLPKLTPKPKPKTSTSPLMNHPIPGPVQWLTSPSQDQKESDVATDIDENLTTNANCAFWLLEQAEHPEVTLSALHALPRLPPNLLLALFQEKDGLFERLTRFHQSLVSAGDERQPNTWPTGTIISGAALFHIFKSERAGEDRRIKASMVNLFGGAAPPLEIPEPLPTTSIEIAKLFVAFCLRLQTSVSMPLTGTLIELLRRVSPSFHVHLQMPLIDKRQRSSGPSLTTSLSLMSIFLDAMIHCAASGSKLKYHSGLGAQIYGKHFEPVYDFLDSVLQEQPPIEIVSHIALAVAAIQWYGRDPELDPRRRGSAYSEVFQETLYSSFYAADKSKTVLGNIGLAFSVSDVTDMKHVDSIYQALLSFSESLFLQGAFPPSYSHFGQGLLRFAMQNLNDNQTLCNVLRVLRRLSDNEWISLYLHGEYSQFLNTVLDSLLSRSLRTPSYSVKMATAGMLDRLGTGLLDDRQFTWMLSPRGHHSHNRAISRYLCDTELIRRGYGMVCSSRIWLTPPVGEYAAVLFGMQVEMTLATLRPDAPRFVTGVQHFFNKLMEEDASLHWPGYFVSAGIISNHEGRDGAVDLRKIEKSVITTVRFDSTKYAIWKGEALLLLWRKATTESARGNLPEDWDDSSFFEDVAVKTVLGYFTSLTEQGYEGFDKDVLLKYAEQALNSVQSTNLSVGIQSLLDVLRS